MEDRPTIHANTEADFVQTQMLALVAGQSRTVFMGRQRGDTDALGLLDHEPDVRALTTSTPGADGHLQVLTLQHGRLTAHGLC